MVIATLWLVVFSAVSGSVDQQCNRWDHRNGIVCHGQQCIVVGWAMAVAVAVATISS